MKKVFPYLHPYINIWTSLAQTVKRLSTMQETRVLSLGWEDPLEKEMATHSAGGQREELHPWQRS